MFGTTAARIHFSSYFFFLTPPQWPARIPLHAGFSLSILLLERKKAADTWLASAAFCVSF
jgi:hypothetical protein